MLALVAAGCLPAGDAGELREAYFFLRLAENRIQALYDRQTHDLPADPGDQQRLALAMGSATWPDFLAALQVQRDRVARHFRDIVFRGTSGAGSGNDEDGEQAGATGGGRGLPEAELARVWLDDAAPELQQQRLAGSLPQSSTGMVLPPEETPPQRLAVARLLASF